MEMSGFSAAKCSVVFLEVFHRKQLSAVVENISDEEQSEWSKKHMLEYQNNEMKDEMVHGAEGNCRVR